MDKIKVITLDNLDELFPRHQEIYWWIVNVWAECTPEQVKAAEEYINHEYYLICYIYTDRPQDLEGRLEIFVEDCNEYLKKVYQRGINIDADIDDAIASQNYSWANNI